MQAEHVLCTSGPTPPLLMQALEIDLAFSPQVGHNVRVLFSFPLRPAVAKPPCEPISAVVPVLILPILPARFFPDQRHMSCTAGPDAVDALAWAAAVRPRAAVVGEHGLGEEGVGVGHEVVCGFLGRRNGLDALRRHFSQEFGEVRQLHFDAVWNRPGRSCAMRPMDEEQVREVWHGQAEVGVRPTVIVGVLGEFFRRARSPNILKVLAVSANAEGGDEVDGSARGTDDSIHLAVLSGHRLNAGLGEAADAVLNETDVVGGDGFQVPGTRGKSPAVWIEVRHQRFDQLGFARYSLGHDLDEALSHGFILRRAAERRREATPVFRFKLLAELEVFVRVKECFLLLLRIPLRFEGPLVTRPGCGDPGLVPGVMVNVLRHSLQVWNELDPTGAIADNRHALASGIEVLVPIRGVS